MRHGQHTELRINGPIRPGNVYCVVTRDSQHPDVVRRSLPASLAVCSDLARDTNRKAGQTLAHVEYIHLTPTETTTTETTERAIK